MLRTDAFEKVEIASADELWLWLEANHGREDAVWLVTPRKEAVGTFISTGEVLDALIAYGWIDGIRRKLDDAKTMQLISQRRVQHWAKSYKERADKLEREGRMREAGRAAIERGKASGLWDFMDDVDRLVVPDDLAEALRLTPPAAAKFDDAAPSYRRNVLRWIKLAKTAKTRAKRIAEAVKASADGRKLPQM